MSNLTNFHLSLTFYCLWSFTFYVFISHFFCRSFYRFQKAKYGFTFLNCRKIKKNMREKFEMRITMD